MSDTSSVINTTLSLDFGHTARNAHEHIDHLSALIIISASIEWTNLIIMLS